MEAIATIPNTLSLNEARLKGRTRGALICGFFGTIWMLEALYFGHIAMPATLAAVALFALTLVSWPIARLESLRWLPGVSADRERWASVATLYWVNLAVEWLLCIVASNCLGHIHRWDLIPQFLGIIIGLHFLPLAKIFRMPLYYATGLVMTVGVLATLSLSAGSTRNLVACSVDGLTLWITGIIILCQDGLPIANSAACERTEVK
jgi:hypothetical protein